MVKHIKLILIAFSMLVFLAPLANAETKPYRGTRLNVSHPLARGLVGAWLFNEGTGNKVFDLSGNGRDGIFDATLTPTWAPGGVKFTNDGDVLTFPSQSMVEFTVIIKLKAAYKNTWVLPIGETSVDPNFIGRQNTGTFRIYDDAAITHDMTTDVYVENTIETWTVSYDTVNIKFYINGIYKGLVAANSMTLVVDSFGSTISLDTYSLNGIIYHSYLYNRALTASEVQQLYLNPYQVFDFDVTAAIFGDLLAPSAVRRIWMMQ